jgi:hypothetical protein
MKKQIIFVALLIAGILGCQKNFFSGNLDTLDKGFMEAEKIYSPISVSEARALYEKKLSEIPVPESEEGNPYDLLPQWNSAGNFNFVDTTSSYLSVSAGKFVGGGYKKLLFMRKNGQLTYFVVYLRGDVDYIHRKQGVCEMTDFCGYVFYKNNVVGDYSLGFRLKDGKIIEVLTPKTTPRPELLDDDIDGGVLGTFTVTATRPSSSSFLYSNGMFGTGTSYTGVDMSSIFNSTNMTSGGGSSANGNSSFYGTSGPIIDSTLNVCPFSFQPRIVSMLNADGTRTITDNARSTAGLKDLTVQISYTDWQGTIQTLNVTNEYLFISMPNNCGRNFGAMVSEAISMAITASQTALEGRRPVSATTAKAAFASQLNFAVQRLDRQYCAGHNSPATAYTLSASYDSMLRYMMNQNTLFTDYLSCN